MSKLRIPLIIFGAFSALIHGAPQVHAAQYIGREFAQRVCAECHAVLPEETVSPNSAAPSFRAIANDPFWTRTALIVWFQTPHPTMPNLVLDADDLDNVIAYILSLGDKN